MSASVRKSNNQIRRLKNDAGDWIDWSNGLENLITDYFTKIFIASNNQWDEIMANVQPTITDQLNSELLRPIDGKEVKTTLFQMNPDKAPGADGMTLGFFQKYWNIVGRDIIKIVRDFFDIG